MNLEAKRGKKRRIRSVSNRNEANGVEELKRIKGKNYEEV
jgi:hypothetical protein